MNKFIEINGTLRAPAYIGNVYYMGGEKITMKVLVSDKKNFAPEVVELSNESIELVEKAMKDLAKEAKAAKAPAAKPAAVKPAAAPANKPAGEIPLV